MKTRVRPRNTAFSWSLEAFDENGGGWTEIGIHSYFWYASWRANRLAKGSLGSRINKKEEFVRKLKEGENE